MIAKYLTHDGVAEATLPNGWVRIICDRAKKGDKCWDIRKGKFVKVRKLRKASEYEVLIRKVGTPSTKSHPRKGNKA
jgi:hypothetical protein